MLSAPQIRPAALEPFSYVHVHVLVLVLVLALTARPILRTQIDTKEKADPVWAKHPSLTTLPVNSVIASITRRGPHALLVKGYAIGSGATQIAAVLRTYGFSSRRHLLRGSQR